MRPIEELEYEDQEAQFELEEKWAAFDYYNKQEKETQMPKDHKNTQHRNEVRNKKYLKKLRRERRKHAKMNSSLEGRYGRNKAKPWKMSLPSAQEMKRKGGA